MTTHSRLHVLVVEGEPALQHLLSAVFHRQGWHVVAEEKAEDARELLRSGWADVLVIDVLLHCTSGLELLEWIRTTNAPWLGHVIVLTALPRKVLDRLLKTDAFCHVVSKPFDIGTLVGHVESCAETRATIDGRTFGAASETIQ